MRIVGGLGNMRTFFASIVMLFLCSFSWAQKRNVVTQKYIDRYAPIAISNRITYSIPASIILAQGILESGSGTGTLAKQANNHFGIKCHNDWQGGRFHKDDDAKDECFRAYDDAMESFRDHALFLTSKRRYAFLFQLKITDYKGWAKGLKKAGYATNPKYPQLLINLIETYELYRYDTMEVEKNNGNIPGIAAQSDKNQNTADRQNEKQETKNKKESFWKRLFGCGKKKKRKQEKEQEFIVEETPEYNEDLYQKADFVILFDGDEDTVAPQDENEILHKVAKGETLYSIAKQYGKDVETLKKLNNISDNNLIRVGDILRVK